ncbi:hypothetical protein [Bradyrhizobium sp. ARR65]|uniref:hypothetical protein n=1 Tax=Bradyrhizobium sp. ARR65 TaxID=1040989 RepID=UPI000B081735|nr:hypothetical protein [Bradyrhizobium sp. ARR65]
MTVSLEFVHNFGLPDEMLLAQGDVALRFGETPSNQLQVHRCRLLSCPARQS